MKSYKTNFSDGYWEERFNGNEPEQVKNAIKRVYDAFPEHCLPQGISDPMYIMNVICLELGIGDGQGNFYLPTQKETKELNSTFYNEKVKKEGGTKFKKGDYVIYSGFEMVVDGYYMEGMVNIRNSRGKACVDENDLTLKEII